MCLFTIHDKVVIVAHQFTIDTHDKVENDWTEANDYNVDILFFVSTTDQCWSN